MSCMLPLNLMMPLRVLSRPLVFLLPSPRPGRFGEWGTVDGSRVWVITDHDAATKAIIVCSYLFVCSFAVSMGPVSWTYPAELFPTKVRGKAVSLATSANWVFNFALAWAVPPGLSHIAYKTYFIFGTFNFAAFVHIFFMYPETVGRSLEEVEDIFSQGHVFAPWKIGRDVGKKTLGEVVQANKGLGAAAEGKGSPEKVEA
ncbi:hypothetical protein B0H10DRAFT_2445517 [Mycena sp. CBHHK59/15]|nr:hypothetical protein B0H10DRAFT_2445517 [Mycena sp. CBHHK59/15]